MAVEGEFPKVDGDVLYGSETNRFNPKLIGNVVQAGTANVSGTSAYTTMGGTITYPGTGSLQISDFMQIQQVVQAQTSAPSTAYNFRVRISGTGGLNFTTATKSSSAATGETHVFGFNHILTSGAMTASGGNIGSSYVISMEGNSNQSSANAVFTDFVVLGY